RVTDLLTPELDAMPPAARVHALILLSEGHAITRFDHHTPFFERALAEAGGDDELRVWVLARKTLNSVAEAVERVHEADAWATDALEQAQRGGPELERLTLCILGWARSLRGLPIDDVCARFTAAGDAAFQMIDSPHPIAGLRHVWRGELAQARRLLTPLLVTADERGEAIAYAWMRLNLCELGLRAGDWDGVSRLLDE